MPSDSQAGDEISHLAQSCAGAFIEISAKLGLLRQAHRANRLVQEHQQHYEAWIAFLGVLSEGKLSLDYRLRSSPEIKSLVLQQLQVLNRNLKAGKLPVKSSPLHLIDKWTERELIARLKQDEHANYGVRQVPPILEEPFSGVKATLDRLHGLGEAIHDASAEELTRRMQPLTNDKRVSSFETLACSIASTLYPCANPRLLEHVSARLALNYQMILYLQDQDKQHRVDPILMQQQKRDQPIPHSRPLSREVAPPEPKSLPRPESHAQKPKQERARSSIISSTFDEREFNKHHSRVEAIPEAPLPPTISIPAGCINYPPPQTIPDTVKYPICQWCLESHPANMFKTPVEWRCVITLDLSVLADYL